ncbi:MAG: hypothetical protein HY400_07535 [Elusimicrobia bacterium]|nr:hypothetical protein [Elusimicrobiota bacterium]
MNPDLKIQSHPMMGIGLLIVGVWLAAGCATGRTGKAPGETTRKQAQKAIEEAATEIKMAEAVEADIHAPDLLSQARSDIRLARNRFSSGIYWGSLNSAKVAIDAARLATRKSKFAQKQKKEVVR